MRPLWSRSAVVAATATNIACIAQVARLRRAEPPVVAAWQRTNFRGVTVDLTPGPSLAAGIVVGGLVNRDGVGLAVATIGSGVVGRMDDIRGSRPTERVDKGLTGHLGALASGRVSSGVLKIGGLFVAGAFAAVADGRRTRRDIVVDAACIAGSANLVNLLDLRPGRAMKAGWGIATIARCFGASTAPIAGACAGGLAYDLREQGMLGDAGANALGAALGRSLIRRAPIAMRFGLLGAITALTLASERISFSAVIDSHPSLRRLDQMGRQRV